MQKEDHQAFILGQVDKNMKDRKFSRAHVIVITGEYKGHRGRVYFADDNIVKIEIPSRNVKVQLEKKQVIPLRDPGKP